MARSIPLVLLGFGILLMAVAGFASDAWMNGLGRMLPTTTIDPASLLARLQFMSPWQ